MKNTIKITLSASINILISIGLIILVAFCFESNTPPNEWETSFAWISLFLFLLQIISLIRHGESFYSFKIWLIIFLHLFMLGRLYLSGLLGINKIFSEGYDRDVFDFSKYSESIIFKSIIFSLMIIQILSTVFLICKNKKQVSNSYHYYDGNKIFNIGLLLLVVGIPCHLIYSVRMVYLGQLGGSYDAITESSGLIDDFANFMIYGLMAIFISKKLKKSTTFLILLISMTYLVFIMLRTGDRRYQTVSILILILIYIKNYSRKFNFKYIALAIFAYLLLNAFIVLRNVRTSQLNDMDLILKMFSESLLGGEILHQTLYEFGVSIYTVALAIKFVPSSLHFKFGTTILSGIISIIPVGFLYQNESFFQYGRIAAELMQLGGTTVGGSMIQDFYSNFSIFGSIIAIVIFGIILNKIFPYIDNKKVFPSNAYSELKYYVLFYALIHLARASFTEVIRTAVWGIAAVYFAKIIVASIWHRQETNKNVTYTKKYEVMIYDKGSGQKTS